MLSQYNECPVLSNVVTSIRSLKTLNVRMKNVKYGGFENVSCLILISGSQMQPLINILGTTPTTEKSVMDNVCEEILKLILTRLPPLDTIKAKSVCRRWRDLMKAEGSHFQFAEAQSYCPLVFRRLDEEHNWSGFCSVTGQWEQLPSLSNVPRVIRLLPFAGIYFPPAFLSRNYIS